MEKITFLQPSYAHYRDQLFNILSKKYNINYIYEKSINTYPGSEKPENIKYTFLNKNILFKWVDLLKYLIKYDPDIVITSIATDIRTLIAYIYSKIFRKKIIVWILNWKNPYYKKLSVKGFFGIIRNNISNHIILNSDALIVGGTASKEYALSLGKKEKEIFIALQCSNDISKRNYNNFILNKKSINKKKYRFLYLSRVISWKGLDILINSFSILEKERDDVELIVAGDGLFMEHCKKIVSTLNTRQIIFLGAIDSKETSEVFSNANIFVLPSCNVKNSYEAWGLVINEAMSMSLPIITTDAVGASYDMVDSGKNGFVVDSGNQYALYTAMNKILDCNILQMGDHSRKIFEEKNSYTNMAQGFINSINYVSSSLD